MADWSNLPYDALGAVALKLALLEDLIYFSAVCRSWNHVFCTVRKQWSSRTPWLLLAENTHDNPYCLRKVFNPSTNKCYQLSLPETFGARCWGSASGWIVVLSRDLEVKLLNPLTRAQVCLPSAKTLPKQEELYKENEEEDREWFWLCGVQKSIVLVMPASHNYEIVVLVIHGSDNKNYLSFARPGDQAWTLLSNGVLEVLWLDGFIYILYDSGAVSRCDIMGKCYLEHVTQPLPCGIVDYTAMMRVGLYLVESGVDLFLVVRYKKEEPVVDDEDDFTYDSYLFEIYKRNINAKVWEEVDDLGDIAVFVGCSSSMSLYEPEATNCKRNCIYFTDDEQQYWSMESFGGSDMGVFDMNSKTIRPLYEGEDTLSEFCVPIWFIPKF